MGNASTAGSALNAAQSEQVAQEAPQAAGEKVGAQQAAAPQGFVANAQPSVVPDQGSTQAQPPAQASAKPGLAISGEAKIGVVKTLN